MEKILDLSKVPKEVLLILELLKDERDITTQGKLANEVDWQLFIDYTVHHRVYPLLYQKLSKFEEPLVPYFVLTNLKKLYQRNTFKMLQLTGEMNFINELLYKNGIQVIFLKGPLLAQDLYKDVSLRTSKDLDCLINIEQINELDKLLVHHGYKRTTDFDRTFKDWKFRTHHIAYFHKEKKIELEIHWRIFTGISKESSFLDLWERKSSTKMLKTPIYQLGSEDLFHFLVVHGSKHGWSRLRWLFDIHLLLKKPLNWNRIYDLCKEYNNLEIAGQSLILTSQLLDQRLSPTIGIFWKSKKSFKLAEKTLFYIERIADYNSPNVSREITKYHKNYKLFRMSFIEKQIFRLGRFYPSSKDAKNFPLPHKLKFMYIFLRPIFSMSRKFKSYLVKEELK